MRLKTIKIFSPHILRSQPFILFLALILSKGLKPIYGSLFFVILINLISSEFVTSRFSLQKYSLSVVLFIGLTPVYLILRGFITSGGLTNLDLQIYGLIFILIFYMSSKTVKIFKKEKSQKSISFSMRSIFAALSAFFILIIVEQILMKKSVGHGVAWIASGDSKNHAANAVSLIDFGSLNLNTFLTQPSSSPAFLALIFSQENFASTFLKTNLQALMTSYAFVWILLIGILGLAYCAFTEIIWQYLNQGKKSLSLWLVAATSVIATFSYVLGPALTDGFFTALFGITVVVSMTNWVSEIFTSKEINLNFLILGFGLLLSSILAWSFVAPATFILFIVGFINILLKKNITVMRIFLLFSLTLGIAIALLKYANFGQELIQKTKVALNTSGAVNASSPKIFFGLLVVLLLFGIFTKRNYPMLSNFLITITFSQFMALGAFKFFSNLDVLDWNYYLLKYQWIMFASIFGLVFSLSVSLLFSNSKISKKIKIITVGLVLIFTFIFSELTVNSNRVWQKIWNGWENPRSEAISRAMDQKIDLKNPTLFFHHGYAGDAMLANFWLTAFADPIDPIRGWNYTIDTTGDVNQMCEVNAYYPQVTIVTSDIKLPELLDIACPQEEFQIIFDDPLF